MNIRQFIKLLQNVDDQDREIVLQKDSEGNGYDYFDSYWTGKFNGEEVGLESLTDDLKRLGYTEDDIMEDGIPVLILAP